MALPEFDRFWLKVWTRGDCWEWRGPRDKNGYGLFKGADSKMHRAHSYGRKLIGYPIHPLLVTDHLCRNRWCVRPSHLDAVTCATNVHRGDGMKEHYQVGSKCPNGHVRTSETIGRFPSTEKRYCKACAREKAIAWYWAHRDHVLKYKAGVRAKRKANAA